MAGDPVVFARGFPPASANEFIRQMLDLLMRQNLSAVKELRMYCPCLPRQNEIIHPITKETVLCYL